MAEMNASGDPFFAAREEVEGNFAQLQQLQREWRQQLETRGHPSKCSSLKEAIDTGVEALAADLRALEKAVAVAARHQQRLGLDAAEIENRKGFVLRQQQQLDALKADVKAALAYQQSARASPPAVRNNEFFGEAQQQQAVAVQQQDAQLNELAHAASRLHVTALTINEELVTHQRMLSDLDDSLERQANEMNFLMRRLAKVVRSSNLKQLWTIIWLFCIALVLFAILVIF